MSKADVKAGSAYVELFVKNNLTKALNAAKAELNDFGSSIVGIGTKVAGMGLAITGSLTAAVLHFADVGGALNDMSVRTGMSATSLVELGYAAKQTGSGIETVEGAIGKMQKNLGKAGDEAKAVVAALNAIHLSVAALSGLSPDEQFSKISQGIADINDPARRAAVSMALFGGSGRELLPMIENLETLRQEARDLGLAPAPEAVAAADEIGDAIDRIRSVLSATIFEIGASIAPMAMEILDGFMRAVKSVRKFLNENKALIVLVAKVGIALLAAGSALYVLGNGVIWTGYVLQGMVSIIVATSAVMGTLASVIGFVLSPVGLLVAALAAGVYVWARFTDSGRQAVSGLSGIVSDTFGGILTSVRDTFGGIMDAVKSGDLALAGQIAMLGLKLVFAQGLDFIFKLFGDTWGTLASQLLTGDFAKAWGTFGASILDTIANTAAGMVSLFTNAANKVMEKWQETVNTISDYILEASTKGGAMGWALEQISGVNMEEEKARGEKIEAERLARGMTPDNNLITDSSQYQDPTLQALKDKVKSAGDAANAMMSTATDATGQAAADATGGQSAAASANVTALQEELALLKAQAAEQVAALNAGKADGKKGMASGGAGEFGGEAKSSAASFNLAALQTVSGGIAQKQLTEAQKMSKFLADQLELGWMQLAAIEKQGLHHA